MKNVLIPTLFLLLLAGSTLAGTTTAPSTRPAAQTKPAEVAPPHVPRDRYDVLSQHNMFVRGNSTSGSSSLFGNSTSTSRPATDLSNSAPFPSTPESAWVLTGTALGSNNPTAIIENTQTGAALSVHPGESIEVGKVLKITTDGIELETASATRHIAVGSAMDGVVSSTALPAGWSQITPGDSSNSSGGTSSSGGNSGASSGNSSGSGGDEAAILERLKKRRAQELSK